ncbi:enoyl-CoA hydratase 2, peroxisomal [Daucus carota subsp. sativus]|uniref:enoyl-CoA hydratase 2, peroxisomal n=1 Tax=Daucus carota subsp. sativus TaxID=79200 RepID=UPI0007F02DF7|nr:PREDICTED: enoyl-CoA hydratase 2, peroxisomal-like [Daucus carota subsp. sativus]
MEDSSLINPELVVNYKYPERLFTYDERDATLYALGVGACATNALDEKELKYVYHEDGQKFIKVLPTFAAIYSLGSINIGEIPGMSFDPRLLLHGQQFIEIYRPLPTHGCIRNKTSVVGLHDKGKAAIMELEVTSYGESSDEPICMNRLTLFLRGAGGFSKSPHPYSYTNYSANQNLAFKHPKSRPFAVHEECTQPSQALVYRLSGDYNPLHSDPKFAGTAGFSRPILHGLCTLGFAVRAIIRCICGGDPDIVKSISGRLLLHVYPGETLITEMWLEGLSVMYQVKVKERNKTVLSGIVNLNRPASTL